MFGAGWKRKDNGSVGCWWEIWYWNRELLYKYDVEKGKILNEERRSER